MVLLSKNPGLANVATNRDPSAHLRESLLKRPVPIEGDLGSQMISACREEACESNNDVGSDGVVSHGQLLYLRKGPTAGACLI